MHKFLTGIIIGGVLAGGICYAASRHYPVATSDDVQKCITEIAASNDKGEVSFHLDADGELDYTRPTCWPEGFGE